MSDSFTEMLDPVTLFLKDDNGAAVDNDNDNEFGTSKTPNVSYHSKVKLNSNSYGAV
jgi:hypothetical protein